MQYVAMADLDLITALEDEIALEGLDGITLEALWLRLQQRPNFESAMKIDEYSKPFLWSLLVGDEELTMYHLPTPREKLVIFNRYEHMDPELGIVLEPEPVPIEIYPFHPIDDTANGARGSCGFYHTRVNVTDKILSKNLQEVEEEYGQALVVVASQMLRNKALYIDTYIDKFYDLTLLQYLVLERIGRSRRMGEITQGKVSLATMGENPKSMFYHRKRLLKLSLITKQPHQQKGSKGQTQNGSLLHLNRFYVERRSKFVMMIQRAVEILKSKPNHSVPYLSVKEEMAIPEASCRKLFKSSEFQRYVKIVSVPYRTVYPDAPMSQWKCKGKDVEKYIRVMELINPTLDPLDICKVEDATEDDEDDETYPGILDQSRVLWGVGLLSQAYKVVEEAGPDGVSQSDMARLLGQTKLDSRTICRNLQRRNTVHSLMKDVGRQRVSRYVSHKFAKTGHLTQEFCKEREKMMSMMEKDQTEVEQPSTSTEGNVSAIMESNALEGVEVGLELVTSRLRKPKTTTTAISKPLKSEASQDNQTKVKQPENVGGSSSKSKGFLSMLEEIRLTYSNQKRTSPHVTTRMMKRANMIIETVRSLKVIDDAFKLQKMIVQAETEEGYPVKMDKKSLNRLLDKLSRGGFLKNIIVKLKIGKTVKILKFVVHPSISFDSPHLKSAIDQQTLKFLALSSEDKKDSNAGPDKNQQPSASSSSKGDVTPSKSLTSKELQEKGTDCIIKTSVGESMQELKQMHHIIWSQNPSTSAGETSSTGKGSGPNIESTTKKVLGTKGSLGPKFVRMCELHKLLFYLVLGYCGQEGLDQEQSWESIRKSSPEAQVYKEDFSSYPTIYCPELSWKMFIPPLPNHMNSEKGWVFVCDVLLRLPLCIFVCLVNVTNVSDEVREFMQHPVKKNILVKFLPPYMRQTLLQGRRYVTYVIDLINRLCYIGLAQYGQQIMKEKDQVFVYINSRASLIDTTTSNPGYHQISADVEYVRKEYFFSCMQDVHQYWYDMWTIAMHTPLGGHNCMQGKKITIQILDRKPQIMESLTPRTTEEAPLRDNGSIPGDGRGAGGLDSAIFAHLKRNWSSTSGHSAGSRPSSLLPPSSDGGERATYEGSVSYSQYLMNTTNPSSDSLSPKHRLAGLRNVKLSVYKPKIGTDGKTMEVAVGLVPLTPRGARSKKPEWLQSSDSDTSVVRSAKVSTRKNKPTSFMRELKMRKKSPKKPYYDEEDRAALRRMNKLRVDWTSAEDSFLLLCKVASCFLFPNKRSQMITFSVVRDMLHKRFPEARNKTSRACQRRINYIMKNPTTEDNVAIFLEEVRQDSDIVAEFKGPRLPRNKMNLENIYSRMFCTLMDRLLTKFASTESRQCPTLPDTITDFEDRFSIIMAAPSLRSKLKFTEVKSITDIDFHVVNALIYSSLCAKNDRDSYAYQLYLAYQQYTQTLLNSVLTRMRHDQMISYKKCYNKSMFAQSCLPLSTSPFQLSVYYHHVFNFKYQFEIFSQSWEMLKRLYKKKLSFLLSQGQESFNPKADTMECTEEHPEEGVPVLSLVEGGFCATIVALLAIKRLNFEIKIPDQIIMMDQQQQVAEDHPESLLRRFSTHSQASGKDDDCSRGLLTDSIVSSSCKISGNDVALSTKKTYIVKERLKDVSDSTSSENSKCHDLVNSPTDFKKRKVAWKDRVTSKKSKTESDIEENRAEMDSSQSPDYKEASQGSYIEEGELNAHMPSSSEEVTSAMNDTDREKEKLGAQEDLNDTVDSYQTGDASSTECEDLDITSNQSRVGQSSASRLGLYMMRDQLSLDEIEQINIQHAQEYLVVNACDIICRLRPSPEILEEFNMLCHEAKEEGAASMLLPLPTEVITEGLEQRRKVTLEEWNHLDEVMKMCEYAEMPQDRLMLIKEIYLHIDSCKEVGASIKDLKTRFEGKYSCTVASTIHMMEEYRLILRVGVAVVRWVTMPYTKPWLIHTNKMSKGHRRSFKVQGVYRMTLDQEKAEHKQVDSTKPTPTDGQEEKDSSQGDNQTSCSSPVTHLPPETSDSDKVLNEQSSASAVADRLQVSTSESPPPEKQGAADPVVTTGENEHASDADSSNLQSPSGDSPSDLSLPRASRRSRRLLQKCNVEKDLAEEQEKLEDGVAKLSERHVRSSIAMRKRKYSRDEESSREMEKTIKHHHKTMDYEQISVAVRPWVRLNGTLNRRVLDRLLGAVLCLIMERPGISGRDIVCRFSPALQPAHTHDLLDTLVHLRCVMREQLIPSHKPSLFSDTVEYLLVPGEIHDCDDELLYEPTVDAIINLGMFIGDKIYSQDFLRGERDSA